MGKNLYRNFLKENEWSNIRLVKKPKNHSVNHAKRSRIYDIRVVNMDDTPSSINISLEVFTHIHSMSGLDLTKFRIDLSEKYNTRVYSYDIRVASFISDGRKIDIIHDIHLEKEQFVKFNIALRNKKLTKLLHKK